MAAARPQAACTATSPSDDDQFIKVYSISDTYEVHAPPSPTQTRGRERSISATLRDRREDVISIPACAHSPPPRLISSCLGVAYACPLQVPWWMAARGKYDIIVQEKHAAKQLQARARAQPCSCAPNPLSRPALRQACALKRHTSSASRQIRRFTHD